VSFDIDANGIVHVSAKDLGTGNEQNVTITASTNLSEEEINKAVREAEQYANEDKTRKEEVEIRNHADSMVYSTEKTLKELGDKIDAADKSRIESEGIDLDKELEAGNFDLINDIYKEFEKLQYDELAAKWGAFIPIEDDLLYTYINKAMRYDGQYYKTNKFLRLRAAEKKAPLSAEIESMRPVIDICRKLSIALWDDRDFDSIEKIINTEIEGKNYGFCIDFELAKLYLKMHKAEGEDDYDAVKTEIEKILKLIPDQGECIKLLGDIAYLKGSLKEAAGYYEKAENITTNGLLLLDIRKKKEEITIENS
ncbi:MAG: Hsp70 family protein, partial [Firmicutes bacterium]|nr:Hsp70 family protein [Bacillota bacterium]